MIRSENRDKIFLISSFLTIKCVNRVNYMISSTHEHQKQTAPLLVYNFYAKNKCLKI